MDADALNSFTPSEQSKASYTGARSLAVNATCDAVLLGGREGKIGVYSISQHTVTEELNVGPARVTDTLWAGTRAIVSTSSGYIKIFDHGQEIATLSGHAGEVTALAVHPSGDILASVGVDKSYIFYDLTSNTVATQVLTDAGKTLCRLSDNTSC